MSETDGRIDYSRLVRDIDYDSAFDGTRFEQYTGDTEGGLGSVLGGWLGAIIGRFVGMALGRVAQETLVDELFGSGEETADEGETEAADTSEADADEPSENGEEAGEPEADAEVDAE